MPGTSFLSALFPNRSNAITFGPAYLRIKYNHEKNATKANAIVILRSALPGLNQ